MAFLQLADMLNDGTLTKESLVKEEQSPQWRRVDDVVGLVAQARQRRSATDAETDVNIAGVPSRKPRRRIEEELATEPASAPRWAYFGVVAVVLFIGFEVWSYWPRTPERFPDSKPVTLQFDTPNRLNQMAPRSRTNPKRPLAPQGAAVRVPGLEGVLWAKNPTLTSDLLSIVYVSWGGDESRDDLFIAERGTVNEPFAAPVKIEGCAGLKREMFPSLSNDGLRLFFSEEATPSRLMLAMRDARGMPFAAPIQLLIDKLPPDLPQLDNPQWLTAEEITFTATSGDIRQRGHFLARRTSGPNSYVVVAQLGLANPWQRYVYTPNHRRAYFFNPDGLGLTMQPPRLSQFTTPELWLTIAQLGPDLPKGDDRPWIAPTEDTIVFCSQGNETSESSDRYLWMLRLD